MPNRHYTQTRMDMVERPETGQPLIIQFATADEIRMRKVVRRSNAQRSGKYPGFKAGRMMQWESKHECNAMRLLDTCPAVLDFREQPCEIRYEMAGEKRRHYPDLHVIGNGWQELWEVKLQKESLEPEILARTELLTKLLPQYGYRYRMVIAENLASVTRLSNAKRLLRLGRKPVPAIYREQIRQTFMAFETLPWGALIFDQLNPKLLQHAARLILEGVLSIDINQPITEVTPVRWVFNQVKEGGASWESLISSKV